MGTTMADGGGSHRKAADAVALRREPKRRRGSPAVGASKADMQAVKKEGSSSLGSGAKRSGVRSRWLHHFGAGRGEREGGGGRLGRATRQRKKERKIGGSEWLWGCGRRR
jgi:hypothetical protein